MLDNFPAEVAIAHVETNTGELVGFASEAALTPEPTSTTLPWNWRRYAWPSGALWTAWVCAAVALGTVAARSGSAGAPPRATVFKHVPVYMPATPVLIPPAASATAAPLRVSSVRQPARTRVALAATKPIAPQRKPAAATPTHRIAVRQAPSPTIRVAMPATPQPVAEPAPQLRDPVGLKSDTPVPPKPATRVINIPTENAATAATIATSGTTPAPERASIWADMDPVLYDRAAVRALLYRYRDAYERLDANAAKRVWPGVNHRALERAFSNLESQTLAFEDCRIDVTSGRGTAHCRGRATYVGRVGTRIPQTQVRDWTFELSKAGNNWGIDSVRAQ